MGGGHFIQNLSMEAAVLVVSLVALLELPREVFPKVFSLVPQVARCASSGGNSQRQRPVVRRVCVLFSSAKSQTHDRMEGSGKFHLKKPVYFD